MGSADATTFGGAAAASSNTNDVAPGFAASIGALIGDSTGVSSAASILSGVFDIDSMTVADRREVASSNCLPIRTGVDAILDQLRRLQQDVPAFLEHSLLAVAASHPQLDAASIQFLPQSKEHTVAVPWPCAAGSHAFR